MGGVEEEEEGRDGQTHYVVEQFVAEVRTARFKTESNKIRLVWSWKGLTVWENQAYTNLWNGFENL